MHTQFFFRLDKHYYKGHRAFPRIIFAMVKIHTNFCEPVQNKRISLNKNAQKIVLLFYQQSGKKCFYGVFRNIFLLTLSTNTIMHIRRNFPTIKRNFSVCKSETHVKLISRLILFICSKQLCCFVSICCDNYLHDSSVWIVKTSDGGMCACIL